MPIPYGLQIRVSTAGVDEFTWNVDDTAEAVDRIATTVTAGAADLEVQVQPGPASKIEFLALHCQQGDGAVTYKSSPAAAGIAIQGVHLYLGPDMAALLGPNPTKLYLSNTGTADVPLIILVGRSV